MLTSLCTISSLSPTESTVVENAAEDIALNDTFLVSVYVPVEGFSKVLPSHDQLVLQQSNDVSLCSLFEEALSEEAVADVSTGSGWSSSQVPS